jgi:hypothetical protein
MIVEIASHKFEANVDVCVVDNEVSHSFQLIASSDKLLLYTPSSFGTNVTYRISDEMKIPSDACREITGEKTSSSRNVENELLDFGTQIFSFLLGKSDKDDENTNFVKSLTHRNMKLPPVGKLHFRTKVQTSLEHKLSEVQSSLQLPPPASSKSLFSPINSAHVPLQQLPAPQVILFYMRALQHIKSCYALGSCVTFFVKVTTCHAVHW